jgi:DNA (cytosine-5)-methyltransferase 1
VADCDRGRFEVCAQPHGEPLEREQSAPFGNNAGRRGAVGGVADASLRGLTEQRGAGAAGRGGHDDERGAVGGLGNASGCRLSQSNREKQAGQRGQAGHWAGATTIPCGDGKTQRIEPGLAPLVDGVPARVVRLRGYGNAIVPQVAAEFVAAYMEIE